jgi:hypothetical protein
MRKRGNSFVGTYIYMGVALATGGEGKLPTRLQCRKLRYCSTIYEEGAIHLYFCSPVPAYQ